MSEQFQVPSLTQVQGFTLSTMRGRGVKFAGVLPFPDLDNTLAQYWGPNFSPSFIDKQVNASRILNVNSVKLPCDTSGVNVGGIQTLASFIANLKIVLDKFTAANIDIYIQVTNNAQYLGGARATLAQEVAACIAICTLADSYSNVLGFDLFNEMNEWQVSRGGSGSVGASQPDATSILWTTSLVAAAQSATKKPITISLYAQSTAQLTANTSSDWLYLLAQYTDFWDIHPYWTPQSVNAATSDWIAFHTLYPDRDVVIGELTAIDEDANSADANSRMRSLVPLCRLPYVTGAFWLPLNDYGDPGVVGNGIMAQDLITPRPNLSVPFSQLPRSLPWPIVPVPGTPDAAAGDSGILTGGASLVASAAGFGNNVTLSSAADQVQFADNFRPEGTTPFTIEFTFKRARTGVSENIVTQWGPGSTLNNNWACSFTAGDKPTFLYIDNTGTFAEVDATSATVTDTNRHNYAISYDGTAIRLFLDGTGVGSAVSGRQTGKLTEPIIIGGVVGDSVGFRGQVDELRISNIARYTGFSYAVPTAPFTVDANTIRLAHLDIVTS